MICTCRRAAAHVADQQRHHRTERLSQAIANRDAGMQLFDQHLAELYNSQQISGTEALRLASNTEAVAAAMRGITRGETSGGLIG